MSARAWRGRRRREVRVRSALRKVWRHHEAVRRFHPVKADWLNAPAKVQSADSDSPSSAQERDA